MSEKSRKKILYYNWVDISDPRILGGGVDVYQRNLIESLADWGNIDVFFLSAGQQYDFFSNTIRIVEKSTIFNCRVFVIVNSPIFSPAALSFGQLNDYCGDMSLLSLLVDFFNEYGPFDVFHINNLEGISINCLRIKEYLPDTRIIMSLHNYYPFCPQVNLWKHDVECCIDNHAGKDCIECRTVYPKISIRMMKAISSFFISKNIYERTFLKRNSIRFVYFLGYVVSFLLRLVTLSKKQAPGDFIRFINDNIGLINKYVDVVAAVSRRVCEIAIEKGISSDKVVVNYIGTKVADKVVYDFSLNENDCISIVYLGYVRKDKGFYFFLECLEKMPDKLASKIIVTIAAKSNSSTILDRIEKLHIKFVKVYHYNGYTHDQLSQILDGVEVGVVPVLWEDNFPQVAKEMYSKGLYIFSSDKGGASELCSSSDFIFKAGDYDDFITKLTYIAKNKNTVFKQKSDFQLKTMNKHVEELKSIYFEDIYS